MIGIKGHPFVELDNFLDISQLSVVHDELRANIQLAEPLGYENARGCLFYDEGGHLAVEHYPSFPFKEVYANKYLADGSGFQHGYMYYIRAAPDYLSYGDESRCVNTELAPRFPKLISFCQSLPLTEIGRVLVFIGQPGIEGVLHRDAENVKVDKEFIWIRTTLNKHFYVYDGAEKAYLQGHSGYFNVLDYHAYDAAQMVTFSFRVDGRFTSELRQQIVNSLGI